MKSSHHPDKIDNTRLERFEKIWNKTKGSDFDKTLAMLYAYCKLRNWGTHANPVWGKIKSYFTVMGYRQHDTNVFALCYTLPYLLLRLSENISFDDIKIEGDLAAILHVIQMHTNINPYTFDQKTELYKAYAEYKDDIRQAAGKAIGWRGLINYLEPKHNINSRYIFISELLKANLIDYIDSWDLIVGLENAGAYRKSEKNYKALVKDVVLFDQYCPIAEENLREFFNSENFKFQGQFLQHLYCKYYKLGVHDYSHVMDGGYTLDLISKLCSLSGKNPIDGVLLLDMVKKIYFSSYTDFHKVRYGFYFMFIALIEKRHLMANWSEIEEILINNKCLNFPDFLTRAILKQSISTIDYLLNEKKINVDIKTPCIYFVDRDLTPLQALVNNARTAATPKYGYEALIKFRDIVKMFIDLDPDCVRGSDEKGRDIFYYLNHAIRDLKHDYQKNELYKYKRERSDEAVKILDEIYAMIDSAYYYRKQAFAFFSCHHNKDGVEGALPMDVVNLIKDHTMYSEITVRNKI